MSLAKDGVGPGCFPMSRHTIDNAAQTDVAHDALNLASLKGNKHMQFENPLSVFACSVEKLSMRDPGVWTCTCQSH